MPNSKAKQREKAKRRKQKASLAPKAHPKINQPTYYFFKDDTTDLLQALEEHILLFLDADDLWSCLKVSKRVNALITNSSKLQLRLRTDLHCLSMPPTPLPIDVWRPPKTTAAEQVAAIIRNQRALDQAQPRAIKCVDRPRTAVHSVSEGFMFMTESLGDGKVRESLDAYSVWQLPTSTMLVDRRSPAPFAGSQWNGMWMWRWHVGEVFIASAVCVQDNVVAIATKPYVNVLRDVLTESFHPKSSITDDDDERVIIQRIYFFPLFPSTGSSFDDKPPPHPECAMPFIDITVPYAADQPHDVVMSLAPGGILGVLMGDNSARGPISLSCWNWKRGEVLGVRPACPGRVYSFFLLDNMVVTSVVFRGRRDPVLTPVLEIWDFCAPLPLSPRPQIISTLPERDASAHFLNVVASLALPSVVLPAVCDAMQPMFFRGPPFEELSFMPHDFGVKLGQNTTTNTANNLITFCLQGTAFAFPTPQHRTVAGVFTHASLDIVVACCRDIRVENQVSNGRIVHVPWDQWGRYVHLWDNLSNEGLWASDTRVVRVTSLKPTYNVQINDFNTHKDRPRVVSTTRHVSKNCPVGLTRARRRNYFSGHSLVKPTTNAFDCPQIAPRSTPNIVAFGASTLEAQSDVFDDRGFVFIQEPPIHVGYRAQSKSTVKLAWEGSNAGDKVGAMFFIGTHLVLQTYNGHIVILFFN